MSHGGGPLEGLLYRGSLREGPLEWGTVDYSLCRGFPGGGHTEGGPSRFSTGGCPLEGSAGGRTLEAVFWRGSPGMGSHARDAIRVTLEGVSEVAPVGDNLGKVPWKGLSGKVPMELVH